MGREDSHKGDWREMLILHLGSNKPLHQWAGKQLCRETLRGPSGHQADHETAEHPQSQINYNPWAVGWRAPAWREGSLPSSHPHWVVPGLCALYWARGGKKTSTESTAVPQKCLKPQSQKAGLAPRREGGNLVNGGKYLVRGRKEHSQSSLNSIKRKNSLQEEEIPSEHFSRVHLLSETSVTVCPERLCSLHAWRYS